MDFWEDDETYDEYSYDSLLKFYGDKDITDKIWNEIQFCKQMHILRPQQGELEFVSKKKVLA